jgi:radical SAM protein with 4Fe4S-binding SPASM domain
MEQATKTKAEIFETTIMKNIRRKAKYIDQVQMVNGVPLFSWIDINPTELCNRKCVFCPRVDPNLYPNQNFHMKVELAQKIADELRSYEYKGGVIFSGFGEPMLTRDFNKLVGAFGRDIHTELVTNGDKLTEQTINELYKAGLDMILVSMYDGPHQIEKFQKLFESAGADPEKFVLRDRWYDMEKDFGLKLTNRAGTVKSGNQEVVDIHRPCYYTAYSMQIDWNGEILLCVQDWNKKVKFGDVNQQTLLEIWTSPRFTEYRKNLGQGLRSLSPCNGCNVNGTLHGKDHAKIWNAQYAQS